MNELCSTIREILVKSSEAYGSMDAVRYKVKREKRGGGKRETAVEARTYRQLKEDSERFSAGLAGLGEQGNHVAIVGDSSYAWIVSSCKCNAFNVHILVYNPWKYDRAITLEINSSAAGRICFSYK